MKSNLKSKIIILITVGILFAGILPIITNNYSDDIAIDNEILKTSEVSGKISINGNSGWASFKADGNCSGFGTQSEPYVIEDLEIDGGGSGSCIFIDNSDVYFEIENCTVYNSESGFGGIFLSQVTNGELTNNTVSFNQGNGINIKTCENITIGNNTINNNSNGIWILNPLSPSANINILWNDIYNNTGFSIFLYRVDDSLISNNTITQTKFGMCINQVNELQVRNNVLFNCTGEGIAPHSGNYINVTGNLMDYCGISGISDDYSELSTYSIDTSNKVNGKPVYFHLDSNNLDNADYLDPGQIILVNCNSSNISEISISYTANALTLLYCNNASVRDCNFSDNLGGIYLDYSNNTDISGNTIDRNKYVGIYLAESNHNSISLNNISNNYDDLSPSLPWQGQPSLLRDEIGIRIGDGSNNNTIDRNTINTNKIGINIVDGANNTIKRNNITENYEYGVFLENYSTFIATLNLVYWNNFTNNGINAQDNGTANIWDNGTIGNYWDDYFGKDDNDDGIGDTPYSVPGSAGSQDNYPIFRDNLIISIGSPIHINNNWTATESTYSWCTGSGTSNDPYIIQDLIIDGGDSGSCILIENSDVYFEIENCTVYNSGGGLGGMSLSNVTNGQLLNNTSSFNQGNGINIRMCENITIGNNTINNNSVGISVTGNLLGPIGSSVNITIVENKIYNHTSFGVYLYKTNNGYVSKNNVSLSIFGIVSISSNDMDVVGNIIEDCSGGAIFGSSGSNVNFTENLMSSCGISIYGDYPYLSTYSIDTSNKVNGKPVYFHLDSNNLDNADYLNPGQIILVNCNSSNISEINISYSSYALMLFYCNNISVLDCNFSNNYGGIHLEYSNNTDISGNTINSNNYAGIILLESNNNSISLNNISNNYDDLSPSLPYQGGPPSPSRDEIGISIRDDSNNNTIDGNTINTNKIGISITKGANNTVKGNYLTENYEYGIFLEDYSRNNLSNLATLNLIYWNIFNNNGINAQDNGTTNMWNNGTIGNSWDDYSGKDTNDDGIGDMSYTIPGSAGSHDNYPIFWDAPIISIDSPTANTTFSNTAPGYEISIEGIPQSMWYTIGGVIGSFNITQLTGTIDQDTWDSLDDGEITITFYAQDSESEIGSTSIIVIKSIPSTLSPDGIPGYNLFFLFGVLSVVAIIISTKLKKFNK